MCDMHNVKAKIEWSATVKLRVTKARPLPCRMPTVKHFQGQSSRAFASLDCFPLNGVEILPGKKCSQIGDVTVQLHRYVIALGKILPTAGKLDL